MPTEFSNPKVADGINNPPEKPVRTLLGNLLLVGAAVAVFLLLLNVAALLFAPYFPFRWERALLSPRLLASNLDKQGEARQEALRGLATKLADAMDLPKGMDITVFYNPGPTVNAFATFGGNIIVFKGLLDLVESEDELSMVLAHEIAHVKHRDAVKGVMRLAGLILFSAGMQSGSGYFDKVSDIGLSGYSRGQEEEADLAAVRALGAVYGNAAGAREFFTSLAVKVEKRAIDGSSSGGKTRLPAFTSSHPDTLDRLQRARAEAERLTIPIEAELVPLPEVLDKNQVFLGYD